MSCLPSVPLDTVRDQLSAQTGTGQLGKTIAALHSCRHR